MRPFHAGTIADAQVEAGSAHIGIVADDEGGELEAKGVVAIAGDAAWEGMRVWMSAASGDVEVLQVGGQLYVNGAGMARGTWQIGAGPAAQDAADEIVNLRNTLDPAALVAEVDGAVVRVVDTGRTQRRDGVATSRYDVLVDIDRLASPEARAALPGTIVYRSWIGPDNLPRVVEYALAGGRSATITYSAWGEPTRITEPSPDRIVGQADA